MPQVPEDARKLEEYILNIINNDLKGYPWGILAAFKLLMVELKIVSEWKVNRGDRPLTDLLLYSIDIPRAGLNWLGIENKNFLVVDPVELFKGQYVPKQLPQILDEMLDYRGRNIEEFYEGYVEYYKRTLITDRLSYIKLCLLNEDINDRIFMRVQRKMSPLQVTTQIYAEISNILSTRHNQLVKEIYKVS